MKLEDQVCCLDLAKKLKELGAKQESLFYWGQMKCDFMLRYLGGKTKGLEYARFRTGGISAFTVAELGEILPPTWTDGDGRYYLYCTQGKDRYFCCYERLKGIPKNKIDFYADTEADARAKMLIYLLENDLMDRKLFLSRNQ